MRTKENPVPQSYKQVLGLFAAILAVVASICLSSCAGYATNASSGGGSGVLTPSPASVSFGNVAVGTTATQSVSVTNTGSGTVSISGATISGGVFTVIGGNPSSTLSAGQSATVQVQYAPTSAVQSSGTLAVTSNATNPSLAITLTGTGMQAIPSFAPSSLNFNNVTVGQTSTQTLTLTNTGNAGLTVSAATVSGTGFSISGLAVPLTLAPNGSATVSASFAPTSTSGSTGSIVFTDNGPGGSQSVVLTGSAVAANATLAANPGSFNFANVVVGTSSTQSITLSNSGSTSITVTSVAASGSGYSVSGVNAGQSIAAGGTATLAAKFSPSTAGASAGTITVASTATNSSLTIALTGTGLQAQVAANPSSVSFGAVTVGNTNSQQITLQNGGNTTLTFSQVTVSGSGFAESGLSTSTTIPAGGSVNFNATFTPTSGSASSGSIALATNGTPSSLTINLSGTGQAASLLLGANPSSLSFGNVLNQTSSSLTTSVTNNGNANVTISSVTVAGAGFSASGIANGTVLTPGQSATLTVTFAPTTGGAVSGASVTVASNATNSPLSIGLTGTSVHSVVLTWNASPTQGVTYNVFRGTSAGGEGTTPINTAPVSQLTFTDTSVTAGTAYYYYIEAVDSAGSSGPSNEAVANVPTP